MKGVVTRRRLCGFTLIELMIAVAIVGLLAGIAYPSYVESVRKARRADAVVALQQIALAQEKWRANNTSYSSDLTDFGWGSATNADSTDGYYTLNTAGTATGFSATAAPKTGSAQASDSCALLTITQEGPDVSTQAKRDCWGK